MDVADQLLARAVTAATRLGMQSRVLGWAGDDPLVLLSPPPVLGAPRIMVAGGVHGDEPAGALGLVAWLETASLDTAPLPSFLPLVNPSGFRDGTRLDQWGGNPNRGYCGMAPLSVEGRILLDHLDEIRNLARDGFLTLHEDPDYEAFYLYTFEPTHRPGAFTRALRSVGARAFGLVPDGKIEDDTVRDGVISCDRCDDAFEDLLSQSGVARVATTETPGRRPLADRVAVNRDLVQAFIDFYAE